MKPVLLQVHETDSVAVCLRDVSAGEQLAAGGQVIAVGADTPRGHKVALRPHRRGDVVRKYGHAIGHATQDIAAGAHVHLHNLASDLARKDDYVWIEPSPRVPAGAVPREFMGLRRDDGQVGIRNEIWILCTVGCVAETARRIAEAARARFSGRTDGIFAFGHPFGCSQLGDDLSGTRQLLAALARHPNAGAVLVVGLGCENNQLGALIAEVGARGADRLAYFNAQAVDDEIEAGLAALEPLVEQVSGDRRVPCGLGELTIGLKCGGSDAFSGLTANPVVGLACDAVTGAGGTAILSEIPELFGAERVLLARCRDRQTFTDFARLIGDFKDYFTAHQLPISENPSPGNHQGGITTLEEKSLGAVQKGGNAEVTQVVRYGGRATRRGLVILESPGNDAVSTTAMIAAGAALVLFTTGRGTPLGFPAPTLKISSNSELAARKPRWVDFDAGPLLDGGDRDALAGALLDLVIATASGAACRHEQAGAREIALWKRGVTL
ncbi:MAG TPA: altronate dehydratase family protein [Steroidobacteraceae bacterium]|nr:altronate dehydratase family protein [Steroidobacteraceae bacterium]